MVFKNLLVLVLWVKVASALEGLKSRALDDRLRTHGECHWRATHKIITLSRIDDYSPTGQVMERLYISYSFSRLCLANLWIEFCVLVTWQNAKGTIVFTHVFPFMPVSAPKGLTISMISF